MSKHPHTMREAGEPKGYGTRAERKTLARKARRQRGRALVQEEMGDPAPLVLVDLGVRRSDNPALAFDLSNR